MSSNFNDFGTGGSVPAGSMDKTVYDANDNNIVDLAENSQRLGGELGSYYLSRDNHTGTQAASTISDFDAEVESNTEVAANTLARHDQNTDDKLDEGGLNEVSASEIRSHIDDASNPHSVGISDLGSFTLAEINAVLTGGDLDFSTDTRTPTAHTHATSDVTSGTFHDDRIAESNVTQHVGAIDHDLLLNYSVDQHREIDDNGSGSTDLFSAEKILSLVNNLKVGITAKQAVRTVATTNIALSGEQTLNGVLTNQNRVGVVGQTAKEENGIYISDAGAWSRVSDIVSSVGDIFDAGLSFFVTDGDYAGHQFLLVTPDPIVLGTTELDFIEIDRLVFGTASGTAAQGDDGRFPTSDEKAALAGSEGYPDALNPYVTDSDTRLHSQNSDTHLDFGEANEVSASDLRAHLDSTSNPHSVSLSDIGTFTLADLNAEISDATLDDSASARTPTAHASSHASGASDEIVGDTLEIAYSPENYVPDDEYEVGGLITHLGAHLAAIDTLLGDEGVAAHASTHVFEGVDELDSSLLLTSHTAVNYTPDASDISLSSTSQLGAHLAGIDTVLADVATNTAHTESTGNPHGLTAEDLGLTQNLGGDYQYFQSLGLSIFAGNTPDYFNKISATTTELAGDNAVYKFSWSFNWNRSVTNSDFLGQIVVDNVVREEIQIRPGNATGDYLGSGSGKKFYNSGFFYLTMAGSPSTHTVVVRFTGEGGSNNSTMWNAKIEIMRVA